MRGTALRRSRRVAVRAAPDAGWPWCAIRRFGTRFRACRPKGSTSVHSRGQSGGNAVRGLRHNVLRERNTSRLKSWRSARHRVQAADCKTCPGR